MKIAIFNNLFVMLKKNHEISDCPEGKTGTISTIKMLRVTSKCAAGYFAGHWFAY